MRAEKMQNAKCKIQKMQNSKMQKPRSKQECEPRDNPHSFPTLVSV
jgi:hypothetical protein